MKCEVFNYLLTYLGFGDTVIYSPGWPWICCVAEAGFEFLILWLHFKNCHNGCVHATTPSSEMASEFHLAPQVFPRNYNI